jgi:hypothetical protein
MGDPYDFPPGNKLFILVFTTLTGSGTERSSSSSGLIEAGAS